MYSRVTRRRRLEILRRRHLELLPKVDLLILLLLAQVIIVRSGCKGEAGQLHRGGRTQITGR